ncbi:MAG: NAD-dependent epimerase/dehydratase family protein [Rhodothermaceae bacterium]|nr:NAD-dependent epimerase/dehydratase family protein [Rhodothermaceae bacterium]
MSRTAFITGADGFVGLNLTQELLHHGWTVFALLLPSHSSTYLDNMGATILKGDITDKICLSRIFPEDVDAVFHVAADTSLCSSRNEHQTIVNVIGTRNVVDVALDKKAKRFVHMSSVAVFGFHNNHIHEKTPSTVKDTEINYFISKALAEQEIFAGIQKGLDAVIINPANIIGPYDTKGWAQIFIKIKEGEFSGIGAGGGSFCHVHEVVRIMRIAVDKGRKGERYILGGEDASYHHLALTAQKSIGGSVPDKPVPALMMHFMVWVVLFFYTLRRKEPFLTPEIVKLSTHWLCVNSSKAQEELGYKPQSLDTMITDACDWLSSENLLPR